MRIYLIGYMYSGKSTVGRQLAQSLGYQFADLDQLFESHYRTSIPLFFRRYGEAAFRQLEQIVLHTTEKADDIVVSTGGGTPCYADNMDWINTHGLSVFLNIGIERIIERHQHSRKTRPLLAGKTQEELHKFIEDQLEKRMPFYRQAHIDLTTDPIDFDALLLDIQRHADRL